MPTTADRFAGSATNGVAHVAGLGPLVQHRGRRPAAFGAPLESALVEHPPDLVVDQEQRGDRRRVVRLVERLLVERDPEIERGRRPSVARLDRVRSGRSPPASTPRSTVHRRTRSTSVARSSTRRPPSASTAARRRRTSRRPRPARRRSPTGGAASSPRRSTSRCESARRRRPRRRRRFRMIAGLAPTTTGCFEVRRGGRRRRRTSTRTRRTPGARCAGGSARTWRRPRTASCRRCRARSPIRRAGRTAR